MKINAMRAAILTGMLGLAFAMLVNTPSQAQETREEGTKFQPSPGAIRLFSREAADKPTELKKLPAFRVFDPTNKGSIMCTRHRNDLAATGSLGNYVLVCKAQDMKITYGDKDLEEWIVPSSGSVGGPCCCGTDNCCGCPGCPCDLLDVMGTKTVFPQ